jgi:hypothetical protein
VVKKINQCERGGIVEIINYLEEINKAIIDAKKRKDVVYDLVNVEDKRKSDLEHEREINKMSAKERKDWDKRLLDCLLTRRDYKDEYKYLKTIAETVNEDPKFENTLTKLIGNLREIEGYLETPIYYPRIIKDLKLAQKPRKLKINK